MGGLCQAQTLKEITGVILAVMILASLFGELDAMPRSYPLIVWFFLIISAVMRVGIQTSMRRLGKPLTWADELIKQRVISISRGLWIIAAVSLLHMLLVKDQNSDVLLIMASGAAVTLLDFGLLWWRVVQGFYGTTRVETEELLAFIAQQRGSDSDDPPKHAIREPPAVWEATPAASLGPLVGKDS
jgi:hypothetical protein